jgi:DNA ligase-1
VFRLYIQPKLDGIRCIFTKDGAYSRVGNQFMNLEHIELKLNMFFKNNPDAILDGELYNHTLKNDFEKIVSLVKKKKPTQKDKVDAQTMIQYHIYDLIPAKPSMNRVYKERYKVLTKEFKKKKYDRMIELVKTYTVINYDEAIKYQKSFLKQGYEGAILRKNGLYKQKRAWELQKMKDFHDTEATIVGYEIGKGKRKGTLGKFLMQDDEGVEFGCPPGKGYTYKDMKDMLENIDDYIGQRATFTYFQKTKAGSYRHPLFKGLRNYE